MKNQKPIAGLVVFLIAFAVSCGSGSDGQVASVNGRGISTAEFDAYLAYRNLPDNDQKKRRNALEEYTRREGIADAIEASGLLDADAIAVELREYRKEMLLSRYFDEFLRENVTDQAVLNYYNSNPEEFGEERIRVAHILLRTRPDMDDSERLVKLTTAREAYSKLVAGEDFAALAKDYSEDQVSGKKGGELGWLKRGAVSEVFSQKVFSLGESELSEPFETPFGFHIVRILEPAQTTRRPFEAAKGDIRYQLRQRAKLAELDRLSQGIVIQLAGGS
jgi:peptidyl-prolyl cis-trans isomerase C